MGRPEERRMKKFQEKEAKREARKLTSYEKAYQMGYQQGYSEGIHFSSAYGLRLYATSFIASLVDEYGFGKVRIERLMKMVQATLEDVKDDLPREEKLRNWIKKKTGVVLDDWTGCRWFDNAIELLKGPTVGGKDGGKE